MKTFAPIKTVLYCFFLTTLFFSTTAAQNNSTFKIPQYILDTPSDSLKIELLDAICAELGRFHPEEVLFYRKFICKLAKKNNFDHTLFVFSTKVVDAFIYLRQPDSAVVYGLKTLEWAKTKQEELKEEIFAWLYNDMGFAYNQLKDYPTALTYYFKALKIKEQLNSPSIHSTYNNIGIVYMKFEKHDKALEYYKKSLALKRKINNQSGISKSLSNIGLVYRQIKNYQQARQYYQQALELNLKLKDSVGIINNYVSIGQLAYWQDDYERSIAYYNKALELRMIQGNPQLIGEILLDIAEMHLKAHQFPEALQHIQRAERIIREHQLDINTFRVYQIYADYYNLMNNSEKASFYYLQYKAIADSIEQEKNANFIAELETKYESEKKEQEIKLLKQQNIISSLELERIQTQRKWIFSVLFLLVIIISVLISLYRYRSKTNKELEILNSTKDKLFTIIGHDLKNPLIGFRSITQSLSSNLESMDKSSILYFIQKLEKSSNELYLLIQNLLQWAINQSGKLSNTPQHFALEQLVADVFNLFKINADREQIALINAVPPNSIVYADLKITQTILRNLIDNAIKFTSKGGKVYVQAKTIGNTIEVLVKDTGKGMSEIEQSNLFQQTVPTVEHHIPQKGTGIGLLLCKELAERLSSTIKVNSTLGKGTIFSFSLQQSPQNA
ncbi:MULTISPECIES: tetratricopeptide repeat-containing sensor histidine kinase [unclassified Aureispira]|uniref:tetratricopeptide repeat-containing sensor histidine kinase n=1 Tax=unclassified Aureispira TaxID=2649989 RepID=UPI0006964ACC|nr:MULTISPECIES: tetratricopeptide repeat-containing sensor histidine kinase [unclassified Aureispira]WMX14706.1 tetratricopeptide repeat-containing sensor histidine kinase [Aureispira sp. CCB-E]